MKTLLITLTLISSTALADSYVQGYTRRDGTYVQGHYKSDSNPYPNDNYSYKGNTNPYTGNQGTKSEDYNQGYKPFKQYGGYR